MTSSSASRRTCRPTSASPCRTAAAGRTKVITNAGGINPVAAGRAAVAVARELGLGGLKVATVVGDDVTGRLGDLAAGGGLANLETGEGWDGFGHADEVLFASAYLGARPIVEALADGADVVITGRVADPSLFLAPLVHEHGWAADDWDRLAAGIALGHLCECSGQSTGGNFSGEWWTIVEPWKLAYPIAECESDGSFVLTKAPGTGGRVDFDTVRHQLLYEVHDPSAYLTPDVVADFTSLRLSEVGPDRVAVTGARGRPATATYKALVAHPAGWAGESRVAFGWPDAEAKARATAAIFRARVASAGYLVDEWLEEYWGVDALGGPTVPAGGAGEAPEVTLRVAWRAGDALDRRGDRPGDGAARALGPAMGAVRDRAQHVGPAFAAARPVADARRAVRGRRLGPGRDRGGLSMARLALRDLCGTRSGDKGDTSNVALFAYSPEAYEAICAAVTAEAVAAHFGSLVTGPVVRYEAANLLALNFVLEGALGGGGPRSLRSDNLGKTLGGALLRLEVEVPDEVAAAAPRRRPDVAWADEVPPPLAPRGPVAGA